MQSYSHLHTVYACDLFVARQSNFSLMDYIRVPNYPYLDSHTVVLVDAPAYGRKLVLAVQYFSSTCAVCTPGLSKAPNLQVMMHVIEYRALEDTKVFWFAHTVGYLRLFISQSK